VLIQHKEIVMIDQNGVSAPRSSASRFAVTGAFVALVVFVACWVAAALGIVASHAFVGLFTLAPVTSSSALVVGGISAAGSGAVVGALMAVGYNLTEHFAGR